MIHIVLKSNGREVGVVIKLRCWEPFRKTSIPDAKVFDRALRFHSIFFPPGVFYSAQLVSVSPMRTFLRHFMFESAGDVWRIRRRV